MTRHHIRGIFEKEEKLYIDEDHIDYNQNKNLWDSSINLDGWSKEIDENTQYWLSVDCVLLWVEGMWSGLQTQGTSLTYDQFIVLPYMSDLEDILNKFGSDEYKDKIVGPFT